MAPPKKERDVDPGWLHGDCVAGDRHKVKCNYCHKIMSGGIFRFKQHLAHASGDTKGCTNVPTEVRQQMRALLDKNKVEKQKKKKYYERLTRMEPEHHDDDDDDDDDDENDDDEARAMKRALRASRQAYDAEMARREELRGGAGSSGASKPTPTTTSTGGTAEIHRSGGAGTLDPFLYRTQSLKQPKISSALYGNMKKKVVEVGRAWAKAFYYNRWAPHAADSPYFKAACEKTAEAGPGVKLPSAYEISNKYLDMEVDDTKSYIQSFSDLWDQRGCTLMCDGWTGTTREHIINFMMYCTRGTIFLKSYNVTGKYKDAIYIAGLMEEVIKAFDRDDFLVQIVTDNEASYRAAARIVVENHPHMFATPCAAHCIDLMLEDMYKLQEVEQTIDEGMKISGLIYNHGFMVGLLKEYNDNRSLLRPGITRFATHYLSLQSICRYKSNLMQMFTCEEFMGSTLYLDKHKKLPREVRRLIVQEEFWERAEKIIYVLEPLILVLRLVDGDEKATMGYLYEALDRAKLSMKARCEEKRWRGYYKPYWKIIDRRWNDQLHQDIHAAGYFLNPTIHYSGNMSTHPEVFAGFKRTIKKMSRSLDDEVTVLNEVITFREAMGSFGSAAAIHARTRMEPADWWMTFGDEVPVLQRMAIQILSQTTSSSGCERNWSTFSLIHTKQRNRLAYTKLYKLVFVNYNMRLRARQLKRQDVEGSYDPINLDYIFEEDDPLNDWLVEREPACFPPEALQSMEEDAPSDDNTYVPSSIPHGPHQPQSQYEDRPHFTLLPEEDEETAAVIRVKQERAKGKQVAGASQTPVLRRSSTQAPQRRKVETEKTASQPAPPRKSTSVLDKAVDLFRYSRSRKGPKRTEKHISPTPQKESSSSSTSKTTSGGESGHSPSGGNEREAPVERGEYVAQGGGYVERGWDRNEPRDEDPSHFMGGQPDPDETQPADSEYSFNSASQSGSYPYPQHPSQPSPGVYQFYGYGYPHTDDGDTAQSYGYPQPLYQPPPAPTSEYSTSQGQGFFDFSFENYYSLRRHDDDDEDNRYGRMSSFN